MKKLRRALAAVVIGGVCSLSTCLQDFRDAVQPPPPEDCVIGIGDDVLTLPCSWVD